MTGPLYALGGFAARRWPFVIAAWIVAAIVLVLVANGTGRPTTNDTTIPGSDSTRATDFLERNLPEEANGSVPIVLESESGSLDQGENRTAIQQTAQNLRQSRYVNKVISPISETGEELGDLGSGGRIGFISVFLTLSSGELDVDEADEVFALADPAREAGMRVSAGGYLGTTLSQPSTRLSEVVGVVAAMIVLLVAFGAVAAMAMPITTALLGLASGLAVIGILGNAINVPSIAPTLGTMLGLAVGVDYSLFIVTRHLRQLRGGMEPRESVARAVATSGGAVVFAGSTVIVALLCLFFADVPLVSQLGYSTAIAVAVVILAALTLLPALLGLLGGRVTALPIPWLPGEKDGAEDGRPHGWARWAGLVGRNPIPAALLGIVLLVVVAIPVLDIRLGAQDNGELPKSTTLRQAYDTLTRGFSVGYNGPLLVAVRVEPPAQPDSEGLAEFQQQQEEQQEAVAAGEAPPPTAEEQQQAQEQEQFLMSPASDPRLQRLQRRIQNVRVGGEPGAIVDGGVSPATLDDADTAAAFSAVPDSAPSAERTQRTVNKLRNQTIPNALENTQMEAWVGGTTAANIDLATKLGDRLPLVIVVIVGISFLLLVIGFRTIVIPAIGAVLNLLAVAASYGILTAVFEKGWGVELIGLDSSVPVVSFVPVMMFAILFGLSMDYTVFLLTRVTEQYALSGDHRRAVIGGLGRAARVIVAAASIMFLVFGSFVINGDPTVKQFGVGLAAAVAIDAFVVVVVLPAVVLLIGRAAWWWPGPLQRLPQLGIEGEEYFEARDAASPEPAGR